MEVVRPEFRDDVFHPPKDSAVFFVGTCRVRTCSVAVSHSTLMLCARHDQAWRRDPGREAGLEAWIAAAEVQEEIGLAACVVDDCNRARKSDPLCRRHHEAWKRAGRPEMDAWLDALRSRPQRAKAGPETLCAAPGCARWSEGQRGLCRGHEAKWRRAGRGDLDTWLAELVYGEDPRVRFEGIPTQLRLELGFGLQCRYDEATKRAPVRALSAAVRLARESGVDSLLDLSVAQWKVQLGGDRLRSFNSMARRFLLDTRFRLAAILIEDDPWADQFPREVWDLRLLGLPHPQVRHLRFESIAQPWLRDLIKRWCRWQLGRGLSPVTVAAYLSGCRRFAHYLEATCPGAGPEDLSRARIEAWLAATAVELPAPTRTMSIGGLRCFLNDVARHGWEPHLAAGALVFGDDLPQFRRPGPRWIEEHTMRQLESASALAQFPTPMVRSWSGS
jgi:hypothetical protein